MFSNCRGVQARNVVTDDGSDGEDGGTEIVCWPTLCMDFRQNNRKQCIWAASPYSESPISPIRQANALIFLWKRN
jgi:hypothetical protein